MSEHRIKQDINLFEIVDEYTKRISRVIDEQTLANVKNQLAEYGYVKVVRCKDCAHYYEAEEYHPQGNYDRRCCKYFGTYDDEVEPDGFCKWAERKEGDE